MLEELSSLGKIAGEREVFVGRQPIFDRELRVYGYELLFRSGREASARFPDGDQATFRVLLNALVEIGLERLCGREKAFVNLTRNALLSGYPRFFAPHEVVLEVLENIEPDAEVLEVLSRYRAQGYRIALDDCIYDERASAFLPHTDIVKVDLRALEPGQLEREVTRYPDQELLAEKVETREEFEHCKLLGFDYFQGYFISKPKVVTARKVPSHQHSVLRQLSRVHDPEVGADEIASLVGQDASLSFRLLRAVNSAQHGFSCPVESLSHAIALLGLGRIRSWVTLLSLAGGDRLDSAPLFDALLRARAAELLATRLEPGLADRAFMVGLLSVLDRIIEAPLEELLHGLNLGEEVRDAILDHEGMLGRVLACVEACEGAVLDEIALEGMELGEIQTVWLEALTWADATRNEAGL